MRYSAQFRKLIERDEILQCPGAFDGYSARVLDKMGFDAIYMTGSGTTTSKLGLPDAGLITMPEMIENANNIQETTDVPVLSDSDNGFGNATNVIRTVREFIKTGVGGIHIEDQAAPKRCGHIKGKQLISKEEAVGKYRAAADVRDKRDEDFVIVARTDARGAVGGSLDDAIDRANAYCDAGADVAFVEAPVDRDEIERIGREVNAPLLYNWAGVSPKLSPEELEDYGFDIVIFPGVTRKMALVSWFSQLPELKDDPAKVLTDLDDQADELGIDLHDVAGFPQIVEWEDEYLPAEEMEKYKGTVGNTY